MPTLATPEGVWLWSLLLAIALYLPLRRLIFVLAMRREQRRAAGDSGMDAGTEVPLPRQSLLKRRAAVTAVLIALIFAALYVHVLAGRLAAPPS